MKFAALLAAVMITATAATPTAKLYLATDAVQAAIVRDHCDHDGLTRLHTARAGLSGLDREAYDAIERALDAAYAASNRTDGELEQINTAFCEAANDR